MAIPTPVREYFQQAALQGTRSTVLQPLGWMIPVLLTGIIVADSMGLQNWILGLLAVSAVLTIGLFLFAFTYCLFKDRDALRSEKYSIQKLAIEKGIIGDSLQGAFEDKTLSYLKADETDSGDIESEDASSENDK